MPFSRFPVLFGRYMLLERLSSGGMAEVYRAKRAALAGFPQFLAIKRMLPTLAKDPAAVDMFVREANLVARLNHANVVQVLELGRVEDSLYIAMELVTGQDLASILARADAVGAPLPAGFAEYVVSQVASGLDAAHNLTDEHGVPLNLVHRDVTPNNILISFDGAVKVADFGIAKVCRRAAHDASRVLRGTVSFMSPEQVRGGPLDRRSDIFALGAILYEAVFGQRLFTGCSPFDVMEQIRSSSARFAQLPESVHVEAVTLAVMHRCLRQRKEDRFATADEVCRALEANTSRSTKFGRRETAELMGNLFAKDIVVLERQQRRYVDLRTRHCTRRVGRDGTTQLFDSVFQPSAAEIRPAPRRCGSGAARDQMRGDATVLEEMCPTRIMPAQSFHPQAAAPARRWARALVVMALGSLAVVGLWWVVLAV